MLTSGHRPDLNTLGPDKHLFYRHASTDMIVVSTHLWTRVQTWTAALGSHMHLLIHTNILGSIPLEW